MSQEFLPFTKPSISQAAIDDVVECLRSGWVTTGPRVVAFEKALAEYCGAPHAMCLSSATAGLHLAMMALKLQPGDEVITTPMTFVATLNTIVHAGGTPVLVDVDPATFNLDLEKAAKAITPKTRAIIPVHFAGLPVDCDQLYDLAAKNNLRVIEDCAHAIGAHYKSKVLGSFGDSQVFSFHPNKNMTTGEGGCVTTRDDEMARQIRNLRFHGIDKDAWNRYAKDGNQHYGVTQPGYKYNMMDIQAAIGLHQLKRLDDFIARRTEIANRYLKELADMPQWQLPGTPAYDHRHAWHIFTPLINPEAAGMNRDEFMAKMNEHNIGTGLHYTACHLHSYYRETCGYKAGDFPIAEDIANRIVSLPLFPDMTDVQQSCVIDTIRQIFSN